jgi:hypothetical protein
MTIAFQNDHVFGAPDGWLEGTLSPSAREGYVVLTLDNGRVFSMQEGGIYGDRDAGTDGPWEQAKVTGNVLAYNNDGDPYGVIFMAL